MRKQGFLSWLAVGVCLVTALPAFMASPAGALSFAPPVHYGLGGRPADVASADPEVRGCTFQLVTFDPGEFKRALECVSDTAGLVPFGRVVFVQGGEAPLYVSLTELACAPWTDRADSACIHERVREQVRRDLRRARDEMQRNIRVRVR